MNEDRHVSGCTPLFPSDSTLHELFRKQADQKPDAIALLAGDQSMTYRKLDAISDQIAQLLIAEGIQPGDFVAIYLNRSFEMMAGILGILKAGGAYVPIDVHYPADRMAFMLEDARSKVILTQSSLQNNIPETPAKVICLDQIPLVTQSRRLPVSRSPSPHLAYMIYTSGSTGKPKGCMITHENVHHQLEGQQAIAPEPIGAMMLTVSISFDVSVLTIFWTLLQGATLVLPKQGEEQDMVRLADIIYRHKVTHIMTLPSPYTLLLEQAPAEKLQSLRLVNVSGEVCPTSLAQKHEQVLPQCQLYNLYGPTEATVHCTYFTFPRGFNQQKVPIGLPILNYKIFILDENQREVSVGEVGEIYIGGTKSVVGAGYWNRPELTAERFIPPPGHLENAVALNSKLYKTGDLGKWMLDGNIEFLGRSDFQVKCRGFRVELGEIETVVSNHPAVKETVVLLKNQQEVNNQHLVAYLTLKKEKTLTVSELRVYLQQTLPEYMLPSHVVFLDKMPLTTNGKFDRNALPEPANERPPLTESYETPVSDLEKWIANKWELLLHLTPVGRHDRFFELGGNSIQAAKFIGQLMDVLQTSVFITTIFDHPTVATYAVFLEKNYKDLLHGLLEKTDCNPMVGAAETSRSPVLSPFEKPQKLTPSDIACFPNLVPLHLFPPTQTQPKVPNSQFPISISGKSEFFDASLIFMFPGGGAQYENMARDLYNSNVYFKKQVDICFEILERKHGLNIREIVFPSATTTTESEATERPANALAALFTIEYALAKLWEHWGLKPAAMIGHSMGEYTAACLSGVMSLESALGLVAVRGRLFEKQDGDGCMLSVALPEEKLRPYLDPDHTISVYNKYDSLVVSGSAVAIERLQEWLKLDGIETSKIYVKVAAHSPQVDPMLPVFKKYLESARLQPPQIPFISNVTGTWIKPEETTDVDYWLRHLRQPVRFADGLRTLTSTPLPAMQASDIQQPISEIKRRIFLEVGPGQTLSTFARAIPTLHGQQNLVFASVRHPKEVCNDLEFIFKTAGRLWVNGVEVNWPVLFENETPCRVSSPTYPIERREYFIPPTGEEGISEQQHVALKEIERQGPALQRDLKVIVRHPDYQVENPPALTETSEAEKLEARYFPLTEGQQEIFLSSQISPEASKAYNIATEIRLEGDLDIEQMKIALQSLVNRHESLRVVFSDDGKNQRIIPSLTLEIPFKDISRDANQPETLQKLYDEEAEHLFDLQSGTLVRFKIIRLEPLVHLIFIHIHHIVCDGWSLGILIRELGEIYAGNIPDAPKQISRYATEQAAQQKLEVFQKNETYWLEQFADGVPVLDLPADYVRPVVKSFRGAVEKISLQPEFVKQLRGVAARQGSTFYMFMLAAWQAYLSRITGQEEFVTGVAAAGHNLPGNANLVAHAVNLLPVKSKIQSGATFKEYLAAVRKQVLDAFEHQQYTFGALVKKLKIGRNTGRNTLVSMAFNLDSPLENLHFGGLSVSTQAIPRHYETFDAFINLKPIGNRVDFEWNFNTDLFRRETIQLRLAEFKEFLHGIMEEMETPVARLTFLPDFELKQLAEFGQGDKVQFPLHRCLHELFEEQVARTPEKLAVQFENQSLSYAALNDRANYLAGKLIEKGLSPGSMAGLCMERSPEMMVCIYAILKAGGAYIPVDPRNPAARIQLMLDDAECAFLFTHSSLADLFQNFSGELIFIDTIDFPNISSNPQYPILNFPFPIPNSQLPAYVIYTSGSTGTPKGVVIRHENAVNTLFAINRMLKMDETDTVFSVSSMSFDMSIPDYFLTLMTGATLILASEDAKKDGFALLEAMERHRPTVMQATPTTWKILLLAGWEGDRKLRAIAGGESLSKDLAAEFLHRCRQVWNGYGPTETAIYATWQPITADHLAACPGEFAAIGRPIANTEMLILDKNGEPVPIGIPGELYIGGKGLASGYLNRPELTGVLFVDRTKNSEVNSEINDQRYYRTGDLVRYLPGGEIEFLGRIDNQVKIRGFRVELGEIEEVIKQFPGISNAAVLLFSDNTNSHQLAGYIIRDKRQSEKMTGSAVEEQLKSFLRSKLPGYMIPSIFVEMEELPLNTSLKIDRKALPKPDFSTACNGRYETPVTPGEKLLVQIWKEILGLEEVGVQDDFFSLGGHSLAAVQMMTQVKQATGKKLPLTALFQHPTVQKLATQLNGFNHPMDCKNSLMSGQSIDKQHFSSLVPIRESGSKPALYLVHGGGLHVLFYQNLIKYLDPDQPIYALQAKGLNGDEEPLDSIEDMAAHYIREIRAKNPAGPYCLAGYSLGGLIAWEMAKQLMGMGKDVPMLFLFDAVAKEEWTEHANSRWLKTMRKTGFNLSLMLRNPAGAIGYKSNVLKLQFQHLKGKMLTAYRNNRTHEIEIDYLPYGKEVYEKSRAAYERYELQPLDIKVDLFKAKEQMFYLPDPKHYGWDKYALQGVIVHEIDGNHLTLFDDPHGKQVAEVLKLRLEGL
jgi:amino acid adenylation domain-containing protein